MSENFKTAEAFDWQKSPLKKAYEILGATTPLELSRLYTVEDQKLFKSTMWDYLDGQQIPNQIKNILEAVPEEGLTENEKEWKNEILWFWYHHATSSAIWMHKDKEAAIIYATKALEIQGNPETFNGNYTTRTLYFLIVDDIPDAETWANSIPDEHEKKIALELIEEYKEHPYFVNK